MSSGFQNVLRLILWSNIWFPRDVPCALEKKNVYSAVVGWSGLSMSVRSNWFIVLLKSSVF